MTDANERSRAIDVRRSVIVQAPAGSGKTTLLVERFLNLLAIVDRPEEILAITFTRKAAAEMRDRIVAALGRDDREAGAIRERSRAFGWTLDEQPTRLRVQTIDGLAAGLVQRLPITSRLDSELHVVEDADALYQEAIDRVFGRLDSDNPLADDLVELLGLFDNDYEAARRSLVGMLGRRDQWLDVAMLALRTGQSRADSSPDAEPPRVAALTAAIGAGIAALHEAVFDDIAANLSAAQRAEIIECAQFASKTLGLPDQWRELPDRLEGWLFVADLVATKTGNPRKQLGRAQGFSGGSATDQSSKLRLKALIDDLAESGAIGRIAATRRLPRQNLDSDGARLLVTVATGLAMSVVELTALFRRDRTVDFTELTYAAQRALGSSGAPTDLALALDYRIKHVLIDEFQDTSAIQHRLITSLLQGWAVGDGRTLFVVGDPMQSIYRFRDADVALFQRAWRHGVASIILESVRLSSNFRASAALVDWCNRVFGPAFGDVADPIVGRIAFAPSAPTIEGRRDDGCFGYAASSDGQPDDEALLLVRSVVRIRREHPGESVAILVRNRNHLEHLLPALSAHDVPWDGTDIHLLAEQPIIDDLLSLLKSLLSDADRLAWLSLLRSPLVGLTLRDLESIAAGDIAAAVRSGTHDAELTTTGRRRVERIRPILQRAHHLRNQVRTRPWLENAFIDLGGADAYAEPDAPAHANRLFSLIESEHPWTVRFDALERSVRRLYARAPARQDAVTVMTIHRAKGLEFDHVLLPALHRVNRAETPPVILWRPQGRELLFGVVAEKRAGSVHTWLRGEEREREHHELVRMFYVAATRARFSLHLFATLDHVDVSPNPPPKESLLGQIWPVVAGDFHVTPNVPTTALTRQARMRRVLPDDYVWQPPCDHPDVIPMASADTTTATAGAADSGDRLDAAIGTIVHRALAALSSGSPPGVDEYVTAQHKSWRIQFESLGVRGADLTTATAEVARQISLVLRDGAGRWILESHADAANETEFTGFAGDDLIRARLDRTFTDAAGVRWVIDYKSSRPRSGQSIDDFVAAQRERHAAQLRRYKHLLENLGSQVRIAIYLTALPLLVELTEPT